MAEANKGYTMDRANKCHRLKTHLITEDTNINTNTNTYANGNSDTDMKRDI